MSHRKPKPIDVDPTSSDETAPMETYAAPWACAEPFLIIDPRWPDETRSRAFQAFPKHDIIDCMMATWH